MIAVDTNVVVRLLTQDDEEQFRKAYSLFDRSQIFLSETVLLETEWVLRHAYELDVPTINAAFLRLFGLPNVHLPRAREVRQALEWHGRGMDFADALHLAIGRDCRSFRTFDRKLVRRAEVLGLKRTEEL